MSADLFFLARSQQRLVTNILRRNPPPNPYREKQLFAAKDKKVLMNVTQMQNPFLFFTRLQLWCQNSFTSRKWSWFIWQRAEMGIIFHRLLLLNLLLVLLQLMVSSGLVTFSILIPFVVWRFMLFDNFIVVSSFFVRRMMRCRRCRRCCRGSRAHQWRHRKWSRRRRWRWKWRRHRMWKKSHRRLPHQIRRRIRAELK